MKENLQWIDINRLKPHPKNPRFYGWNKKEDAISLSQFIESVIKKETQINNTPETDLQRHLKEETQINKKDVTDEPPKSGITYDRSAQRHLKDLKDKWPSTLVARSRIAEFSGGTLTPGTLANLDSKGLGPLNRIRVGRKVAYPVAELIEWMLERSELLDRRTPQKKCCRTKSDR